MFSLARRRREAERHKKLEEQFLKKDANGNGRITAEQMVQIFEENEVQGTRYTYVTNFKRFSHKKIPVCHILFLLRKKKEINQTYIRKWIYNHDIFP